VTASIVGFDGFFALLLLSFERDRDDEYDDEYDDEREYERDRRPMLYYECFLYRPFVFVRAPCVDDWGRSAARIELFLNLFVFLIQIEVATGWSYK
jgi:hypothetical protein